MAKERIVNLENMENPPREAAENNRCGFHRVKVVSQKFTVLGVSVRKITRNDARYLAGYWKTNRATNPRQRTAALSMNAKELRDAC